MNGSAESGSAESGSADRDSIAQAMEQLRQEIREHDHLYYVQAAPRISDLDYDRLIDRLKEWERLHPELITSDSPTQRVGETPVAGLEQVAHRVPMLSIDNTYNEEELLAYFHRIEKLLEGEEIEWVVELKIDGVAASILYDQGVLVRAMTRGNGEVGDDITHNMRTVSGVPLRLLGDRVPESLEVRGEVYMTNSDLVLLNESRAAAGEPAFKNTRNVTAGTIRLLDSKLCAQRRLRFFCHGVGFIDDLKVASHMEFLDRIQSMGIPGTPMVKCLKGSQAVIDYCHELLDNLHDLNFEVDGLVIKVNSLEQRKRLGTTSKSPRWVIAYKLEKYEAVTRLNEIRTQVGKTGTVTPVGELEPVELAGTTVSRCSLHNIDEIARKDIRVGDWVVVEKAGKIIPHIVRVEKHMRTGELAPYAFPTHCPECHELLVRDPDGVYIRCVSRACPAQWRQRLRYYASRDCMDIEGLGDKLVNQLVDQGLVQNFRDLYQLSVEELTKLERMGEKSAKSLVDGIAASRQRGLGRLLNAISIRHVGQRVARTLARHFRTIDAMQAASIEQLSSVSDVGAVIAQSVFDFLHSEEGKQIIEQLKDAGVVLEESGEEEVGDGLFTGKTFVVTGTLSKYSRDEIHEMIEKLGGKTSSSVSKSTHFLVAGEKAGSKLDKAKQLGITILSEGEFEAMTQANTSGMQ